MTKNNGSKTAKPMEKKKVKKWRTIKEFPDYIVSEDGEVYSKFSKKMMTKHIRGKYYMAKLRKNNKTYFRLIHILVAKAFIKNPKKLPKVDHIDNDRLNNHIKNLRWITQSGNMLSYHRNFRKYQTILQCDRSGNVIKKWKNTTEIIECHKDYNRKTINNNIRGRSKSAYGYIWMYETHKEKKIIKLKEDEIFKNIGIFENNDLSDYYVSDHGNIKNKRGMILASHKNDWGYMVIYLTNDHRERKPYRIHRLVAHAFISNSIKVNDKVNHLDEDKCNNFYKNLEWITQQNNVIYSIGKKIKMIDPESDNIIIFKCINDAYRYLGVKLGSNITKCCKGIINTAYRFKWQHLKEGETLDMYKKNDDVFIYDL